MRTFGIDLAASGTGATPEKLRVDSPFRWPNEFLAAITAHHAFGRWPGPQLARLSDREADPLGADMAGAYPTRCEHLPDQFATS